MLERSVHRGGGKKGRGFGGGKCLHDSLNRKLCKAAFGDVEKGGCELLVAAAAAAAAACPHVLRDFTPLLGGDVIKQSGFNHY